MKWMRMFSYDAYKGTPNYLKEQRKYEICRTVLFFALSLSLFIGGYITTHTKTNLLTIVAVLGCLPASKSLISVVMFCKYKGLAENDIKTFREAGSGLKQLYDMVFTGYEKTFVVPHLVVKGDTVVGFSYDKSFDEKAFLTHIQNLLKADGLTGVTIKIFTEKTNYLRRLSEVLELHTEEKITDRIIETLKSVSL